MTARRERKKKVSKRDEEKQKKKKNVADNGRVNVTGLDRGELLHALWYNAAPTKGYAIKVFQTPSMPDTNEFYLERAMANDVDKATGYVDYTFGRLIKCYLFAKDDNNEVDASRYDYAWGTGAFQEVVDNWRKTHRLAENRRTRYNQPGDVCMQQ